MIEELDSRGVAFKSLTENIDTSSDSGRLVLHIFASLAEFERALLSERTKAGLAAARARGARPGRRPSLSAEQVRHARLLVASGESVSHAAGSMGVHRATLYRALGAAYSQDASRRIA
ncbi:recombinase family protein [Tsukamurella tyrosinosolvens]|uniref:recombinase family protein n=1 Tax=Tsukamurella tyrosinosolvens TaxID=57704 RepID=UPI003083E8EB